MSPHVTPDLERRSTLAALREWLILALVPLLLYLGTERYLPADWFTQVSDFLCFKEPIDIHGMGDGSCQEVTEIGTDPKVYFAAITTRGGEVVQDSRSWSFIDYIFP